MGIIVVKTPIEGILMFEPEVHCDARGSFFEAFNQRDFVKTTGLDFSFKQVNISESRKGVLRGLHYQVHQPQGKLICVLDGEIFDVAVDLRRDSPNFGRHLPFMLLAKDRKALWIPPGFAHGFLALSEHVRVLYQTTDYWAPEFERTLIWNDPRLAIRWPLEDNTPILSKKDSAGIRLADFPSEELLTSSIYPVS